VGAQWVRRVRQSGPALIVSFFRSGFRWTQATLTEHGRGAIVATVVANNIQEGGSGKLGSFFFFALSAHRFSRVLGIVQIIGRPLRRSSEVVFQDVVDYRARASSAITKLWIAPGSSQSSSQSDFQGGKATNQQTL
jgi:hypothetical protein